MGKSSINKGFYLATFDYQMVLNIQKPDVCAIHPDLGVSSASPNWSCVSINMLIRDQNDDCK